MRIPTLLQKIAELADQPDRRTTIDVDLMLDYTRVLYADLLEWRGRLANPGRQPVAPTPGATSAAPKPAAAPVAQSAPPIPPKPVTEPVVATPAKPTATTTTLPDSVPVNKPAANMVPPVTPVIPPVPMTPIHEPTLAELAAAMDKSSEEEEENDDIPLSAKRQVPQPSRPENKPAADTHAASAKEKLPAAQEVTSPASKPQAAKTSAPKDIRSFISINEKYQIMSELFGNDKGAYEEALNYINTSENEAAALKWLQERLWVTEERSDAVQYFFDLVRRFKSHPEQGFLGFRD